MLTIFGALFTNQIVKAQTMEKDVIIIELIQSKGQFETQKLNLNPGKYQFRVVNKDVDKGLGFAIQRKKDKDGDLMKTAIPESFTTAYIKKGKAEYTKIVNLEKGKYVYSCPLNPTPHYKLIVK